MSSNRQWHQAGVGDKHQHMHSKMNLRTLAYQFFDTLPVRAKAGILFFADQCIVMVAFVFATILRMNDLWPANMLAQSWWVLVLLMICAVIAGYLFGTRL